MVVTSSLARGAVRAAAETQSRAVADALARLKKGSLELPASLRRFARWFHKIHAMHENHALLIVFGMIGRRKGGFAAFLPQFEEIDNAWNLGISALHIEFSPGNLDAINQNELSVRISGHAIERMFQRANTIEWAVIRDCLAGATLFLSTVADAYVKTGCKRCAIPAEKGMLVGQIADEIIYLRTFLPDFQLSQKWQSLYEELLAFSANNAEAINAAVLVPDDEVVRLFGEILKSGRYGWLFQPYVPGYDLMEDAWRSSE